MALRTARLPKEERSPRPLVIRERLELSSHVAIEPRTAAQERPFELGRGIAEVRSIEDGTAAPMDPTRSRRPGAGRKKATEKDPTLLPDLQALVEATTRGDPESPFLWTARSQRNIVEALAAQGHSTSMKEVSSLLKQLGYSLQANRKRLEGAQHPDRNAQFEHINEILRLQLEANQPAISVDTKKKELVGSYKNGGRELRGKGDADDVNVHDVSVR
ncbi:MAG: hypothetical protein IPK13_21725 [Deltaproteobacteria bacterium]|nr:hypothetical protein [Deltaproteobacteria bacterium]